MLVIKYWPKKDYLSRRELSSMFGSLNPLPTKRSKVETGLIFFCLCILFASWVVVYRRIKGIFSWVKLLQSDLIESFRIRLFVHSFTAIENIRFEIYMRFIWIQTNIFSLTEVNLPNTIRYFESPTLNFSPETDFKVFAYRFLCNIN